MEAVCNFFQDVKTDITVCATRSEGVDNQNLRMLSIALRIVGVVGVLSACSSFFSAFSIFGMAWAVLNGVISHDLVVIGCNQSEKLRNGDQNMGSRIVNAGVVAPYYLHRTWIAEPLYKAFCEARNE